MRVMWFRVGAARPGDGMRRVPISPEPFNDMGNNLRRAASLDACRHIFGHLDSASPHCGDQRRYVQEVSRRGVSLVGDGVYFQ
jgi:hypothetical protein